LALQIEHFHNNEFYAYGVLSAGDARHRLPRHWAFAA
jgi:hypothetical protein